MRDVSLEEAKQDTTLSPAYIEKGESWEKIRELKLRWSKEWETDTARFEKEPAPGDLSWTPMVTPTIEEVYGPLIFMASNLIDYYQNKKVRNLVIHIKAPIIGEGIKNTTLRTYLYWAILKGIQTNTASLSHTNLTDIPFYYGMGPSYSFQEELKNLSLRYVPVERRSKKFLDLLAVREISGSGIFLADPDNGYSLNSFCLTDIANIYKFPLIVLLSITNEDKTIDYISDRVYKVVIETGKEEFHFLSSFDLKSDIYNNKYQGDDWELYPNSHRYRVNTVEYGVTYRTLGLES